MIIIPQVWADEYRPLPAGWLETHAPALIRAHPTIAAEITEAAMTAGVDERLLVTRMQIEQSAITYAWDGSARDYPGGDASKLRYLCGVDRTDSGDRAGGWFGVGRQLLGCALRFTDWYRGADGPGPGMENWLKLREDPRFAPGVPVTRAGVTITPTNQASADCLRYTTSMAAQHRLREIGMRWFAEDYHAEEEGSMASERQVSLAEFQRHLARLSISRRITEVIVHHTWRPAAADYRGISTVAGVRRYHMQTRGWRDNGYHVMIGPDSAIFLCRPMGQSGAHTLNRNANSIGISFIANFDVEVPSRHGGMSAGRQVVAALLERFGLGVNAIRFHREFAAKSCPGGQMNLSVFRDEVAQIMAGETPTPAPAEPIRIVLGTGPEPQAVIDADARVEGGTLRADVRPLLEALGYTVHAQHVATQRKLYIEEATS